ncbi:MAG: response regulator transcription factor [Lactovum sp.]
MAKKIYIADDETPIRLAVKAFLEKSGFLVYDFENGDDLLVEFEKVQSDLIILDIMMPGSNGFVICKAIREESDVPIIMLSARGSDLDSATGLAMGSNYYFTKPFSPMSLTQKVKEILEEG